jgi:hypothetical protein
VSVEGNLYTYGESTFEQNVGVNGGSFVSTNYPINIKGNLAITGSSSPNGFWTQYDHPSHVGGNFSYTGNFWPGYLYVDYLGAEVAGNFTYANNTTNAPDINGLVVDGNKTIS